MRKGRKILAAVLVATLAISIVPGNSLRSFAEEGKEFPVGDANGDGEVDSKDALAILKYNVGIEQSAFVEEAAAADSDGEITAKDALTILKYNVGIIEVIPAACMEHVWDDGKVLKEATLTEEGLVQYSCTLCGSTRQKTLPVLEACTEHKWDDGKFVDEYFSEPQKWTNGYAGYNPGWQLEIIPSFITDPYAQDIIRQFIVFSDQIYDYDFNNQVITRYCEEGLKEYTCRICGEKKTDFCVKKRPVPVEADSVKWADGDYEYRPVTSGWTGKYCWLEDERLTNDAYALSEEIYTREQEKALDDISARFVSGNLGLYEYEAAVREYLSGLNIFDTSKTKGELLIGCNIYFQDNLQSFSGASPGTMLSRWIKLPDGSSTQARLEYHDFQYIYLNSYYDKEEMHSVNFTISLYVDNPLFEK